jgi:ABC-type nitrate/sulfonate/bicarbonate transport system permease component
MTMLSSSKMRFAASFLIILAAWWVSSGNIFVEQIVPKPDDVAVVFFKLTANGKLFWHIFASLQRICIGYAIGHARIFHQLPEASTSWRERGISVH